jgi:nicotinamidase-related amidase
MKVLLIIDMQNEAFHPDAPFEAEEVVKRINALSSRFRKEGDKIIIIQHDGTSERCFIPFTKGWEIIPSLETKPGDLTISKTANDSFYKTLLKAELEKLRADELVVTGCATDFCVDATVKSALVNDLNVTVVSNAHTAHDRPYISAKQVVDHYNWIWREMSQTKSKIKVVDFESYMDA